MDKKEDMNRWQRARTFRPLLLWGGLAVVLMWGCFNPVHVGITGAPDQDSENQGSENPGSENQGPADPGDGAAGEFTVTLRVGEDSRSVVGPGAEDIPYSGVCNTVQVIAVDAETQEVKDNQVAQEKENDSGKTIWVNISQGKRYHFLVLMGYGERDYEAEKTSGGKYVYKPDPPTLLAAGFLGDQAINGQAAISITMKPLVVDTVFTHGDSVTQAALPNPKPQQLPAGAAASMVWTVTGGFATLVDAQTRSGIPGGLNWGGLSLAEQKTMFRITTEADDIKDAVLGGADRNQIVLDLGARSKGVSGSANFKLTYNPLGEKETWIIRNGVNDLAQDEHTTFALTDGKIPWSATANGNGAVAFEFVDREISRIDLTRLVPAPGTGVLVPTTLPSAEPYKTTAVTWKAVAGGNLTDRFERETTYLATVTLAPADGFFFFGDCTVTHDGSSGIMYKSKTASKVVVEVLFPKTGAFWEYGYYFSGSSSSAEIDSAIDVIIQAKNENFSALFLKLLPWPETVNLNASAGKDIGEGLKLTANNSPAAVIINGGGKVIELASGTGSVITVGSGVTLTLQNITFKGSSANTGSLITVETGGTLVLEDGAVITGNVNTAADNGGGGVSVAAGGTFTMNGSAIISNNKTGATNGGGGVYMTGAASAFTMSGGEISANVTSNNTASGGGVSVYGGTFTMSGTALITANALAYAQGDGVYVKGPGAKLVMEGGEISGHSVTGVGVDNGGVFEMSGGKISGNTNTTDSYDRNGGGVRLGDNSSDDARKAAFTMTGGEITKNTAKSSADDSGSMDLGGGGVWMSSCSTDAQEGPTFTMSGTAVISNNTGGGVRVGAYTTFTMDGGTISGNTNGVYGGGVQAAGSFIMKGGTIHNNEAQFGGGVAGELTMNGGTIKDNEATKGGGGVWSKDFNMTKGTVSGNKAPTGGGALLYYDGTTALAFTKTVGIIYGKDAGGDANAASSGDTYGHALYYQAGLTETAEDPKPKTGNRYYDVTAGAGVTITVTKNPSTDTFVGWDTDTGIGEVTTVP